MSVLLVKGQKIFAGQESETVFVGYRVGNYYTLLFFTYTRDGTTFCIQRRVDNRKCMGLGMHLYFNDWDTLNRMIYTVVDEIKKKQEATSL